MPTSDVTEPHGPSTPEEFRPEWTVHPGALIQREIDAAGFSQAAVAARTGISAKHLNQVLRGHVALSADVAVALERVLDSPGDLWLRMDATWQVARSRVTARDRSAQWTEWLRHFPTAVLTERGVWQPHQSAPDRVDALLVFFGVVSPEAFDRAWLRPQASYRRSQKFDIDAYSTAVWLRLVETAAAKVSPGAPQFDETALKNAVETLPRLTQLRAAEGLIQAQRILEQVGVLLIVEPEIANTRICGVTRWSTSGHPIIALTGRQRHLDVLWFSLLHELGHVLLHPKRTTFLELDGKGAGRAADDDDAQESAADKFAADVLLPAQHRDRVRSLASVADLEELAADAGVSAGIVAGRYGHETQDWAKFGKQRIRIGNDDIRTINGQTH